MSCFIKSQSDGQLRFDSPLLYAATIDPALVLILSLTFPLTVFLNLYAHIEGHSRENHQFPGEHAAVWAINKTAHVGVSKTIDVDRRVASTDLPSIPSARHGAPGGFTILFMIVRGKPAEALEERTIRQR